MPVAFSRRGLIAGGAAALACWPSAVSAVQAAAASGDDMAVLRAGMNVHPGLLRYATERQMLDRLAALRSEWSAAPALEARYLALSRFLTTIRCGHSYANFFNQSDAVAASLFDRRTRLPFAFRWVDGRMIVLDGGAPDAALARGTRVRSIDGVRAEAMLRALMPYARADGSNDGKRVDLMGVRGSETIETFDVFQGLLFPPKDGLFRLEVEDPDGRRRRVELPAIGLAERRAGFPAAAPDAEPWQWEMRGEVAVLTMAGWGLYDGRWPWEAWLEERLDSLGNARGLVIDIRENEGGLDCGDPILARLITSPLGPADAEQRIRFRDLPPLVDANGRTWNDAFRTMGRGARYRGQGFFERPGGADAIRIDPAPPAKRLRQKIALLTSPTNSSATFVFAEKVKRTGVMRLFGETTGGNRRGINGDAFMFVTLPDSGIEFDLPLVGLFPRVPQPDAGIEPGVRIGPTRSSIIAGNDLAMSAAIAWAGRA